MNRAPSSRSIAALALVLSTAALGQARPVAVLREVKPEPSPALESSLREMLGRLDVNLDSSAGDGGTPALAVVDVDFDTGAVTLDSPSRGLTIRRSLGNATAADVRAETAATLIASAIDVLLHTDPPRQAFRPVAELPAVVEAPPPKPKLSPVGLDVGVGLSGRLLGGSPARVDFGGTLSALLTVPLGRFLPGVLASVSYQPAFDLAGETVTLRGSAMSARLFVQLEVFRFKYGRVEVGAGGGFDRFEFTPLQREGELFRQMAVRATIAPVAAGLVTYRLPIGDVVHLFATAQVDGDLRGAPPHPTNGMMPPDMNDPRPWVVRPSLIIGVSFAPLRARE